MDDLISRGDAIKAVLASNLSACTVFGRSEEGMATAKELIQVIKNLPSVQPEIIRCRDCKHFEYDHPYVIQGVPVLGHLVCNRWGDGCKTDEDGFCFMGERREDE